MAIFDYRNDLMKHLKEVNFVTSVADEMLKRMTRAGAEVALNNIRSTAPMPEIAQGAKLSRTYKTPSDDGVNTKVYFKGYIPFKGNRKTFSRRNRARGKMYTTDKGVPIDFIAQVTEYGTSERSTDNGQNRGKITKKPFLRKAFRKDQIVSAMLKVQKEESGGLL